MAQVFAALGSSVTVIERGDRLLGRAEPVASAMVRDGLKREGATIRLGVTADSVSRPSPGGPVSVHLSDGSSVTADEILCALGRTPRTEELGLETVGVKVDERGYVEVDDTGEVTSVPGQWLYAVGDVNGRNLLTHMGKYQGRVAGDVIAARAAGAPHRRARHDGLGRPPGRPAGRVHRPRGRLRRADRGDGPGRRAGRSASSTSTWARSPARACRPTTTAGPRGSWSTRRPGVVLGATFVGQDVAEMAHAAAVAVTGAADRRHAVARRTVLPHHERGLAAAARGVRAVTSPPPEIDLWDGARARVSTAAAVARVRRGVRRGRVVAMLAGRRCSTRTASGDGFRLSVARCDHEIVGFAYGFVGERGQPWSDRVAAALPAEVATSGSAGTSSWRPGGAGVAPPSRRWPAAARRADGRRDPTGAAGHRRRRHGSRAAVTSRGWQRLGLLSEGVQVMGLRPPASAAATTSARRLGPRGERSGRQGAPLVPGAVGRGSRIRTGGLPLPKRTRYQAAPYPVAVVRPPAGTREAADFGSRDGGH